jgi:hypothetical protein
MRLSTSCGLHRDTEQCGRVVYSHIFEKPHNFLWGDCNYYLKTLRLCWTFTIKSPCRCYTWTFSCLCLCWTCSCPCLPSSKWTYSCPCSWPCKCWCRRTYSCSCLNYANFVHFMFMFMFTFVSCPCSQLFLWSCTWTRHERCKCTCTCTYTAYCRYYISLFASAGKTRYESGFSSLRYAEFPCTKSQNSAEFFRLPWHGLPHKINPRNFKSNSA